MSSIKKIEFYLDFPQVTGVDGFTEFTADDIKNPNITYDGIEYMHQICPIEILRGLVKKYPEIEFIPINTRLINKDCCCPAYGVATPVIKNPETGKFMILSYCDKGHYITKGEPPWGWDLDNCVDVFQPIGVHVDDTYYKPLIPFDCIDEDGNRKECLEYTYTPCTMSTYFKSGMNEIEKLYSREDRKIPEKLFLRGGGTPFRKYLRDHDDRFDIYWSDRLVATEFMQELSQYSIIMDVNSIAEISGRLIDGMGLGCAVIRPELVIQYHNKLIPNYHYAKVECDDLSDFPRLANAYIEKFEELKNNPNLVEFIGKNGRKWYEENSRLDSYSKLFVDKLINLEKLL